MAVSEPPDEHLPGDDTTLLIAALNHAWAFYDARINRGLQVINYFLVASAVLATAYVSAINGKHYPIAAIIALSETALAAVTYTIGSRERRMATAAQRPLAELQARIADRLVITTLRIVGSPGTAGYRFSVRLYVRTMFGLAVLLSVGAALYALVH
jgi:hypothetical protein